MSWWKEIGVQFRAYLALWDKENPQSIFRGSGAPCISCEWKQVILWFHWESNPGFFACEADVMTTTSWSWTIHLRKSRCLWGRCFPRYCTEEWRNLDWFLMAPLSLWNVDSLQVHWKYLLIKENSLLDENTTLTKSGQCFRRGRSEYRIKPGFRAWTEEVYNRVLQDRILIGMGKNLLHTFGLLDSQKPGSRSYS